MVSITQTPLGGSTFQPLRYLFGEVAPPRERRMEGGFNVDTNLTMTSQMANVCRSAYYHLSRIAKIRDSISTTVCKSLIHGLVTSRLDYGNAILYGLSDRHMHRLEMVQRSAARIVRQIRRGDRQSMCNNTAAVTLAACQKANRF
ncbi:hypothetical protein NP493_86g02031 [Ridgeia piscesae]|uniref:Uncharacterized protein n=1 Tax=Ridgeia piscesae TaxID=27915 RepID=A0AAD9P8G7_RIDPI|nr:hypothetical protein NP493_86g02031 [Ridgeia piscesae]